MKLLNFAAWGHVLACLFFATLFVLAAGFTLTTTQMLFMHGFVSVGQLHYGWDAIWQLYSAVNGEYSGDHLIAVIISWMLLACYTIANSVKRWVKSGVAHEGIELFCHIMLALDSIANWVLLSGYAWYWQIIFVVAIYIALAHFGKLIVSHATLAAIEFF